MARRIPHRLAALSISALVAGLLLAAEPALPGFAPGPVDVVARDVTTSVYRQAVIDLPIAASDITLHWQGAPEAVVTVAFATSPGTFGEEVPVDHDAGDVSAGETYGDVIWAADARVVRVTSDRPIDRMTVVAIQSDGSPRPGLGTGPVVDAALAQPGIVTRAGWGANEALRFDGGGHELWPPSYSPIQKIIVHQTAGRNGDPNPAATVRAIYYDDAVIRGWGDLGYNWLIDEAGNIYEGRHARTYASGEVPTEEDLAGNGVRGAHAQDFNDGTVGIAMLGTFDTQLPTSAARSALIRLIAWITERHGINPTGSSTYVNPVLGNSKFIPNIAGHRDVNATDCPGTDLYAYLPTLRSAVASRIAASTGPTVDHIAPTVRSLTPLATNPTGAHTISFGLIFSEPVTGLSTSDFAVTGTSPGWTVKALSGKVSTYTVTVGSDTPTDGSVVLTLANGSIVDLAGNLGPATAAVATAQFATDTTAPTVSLYATPHVAATNATSFSVTVTFDEPVVGLTAAGLSIGGTSNAATPWTVEPVVGSGAHYGFSIHRSSPASGTLTFAVRAGATKDPAGNPSVASAVTSILIDRIAPKTGAPIVSLRSGVTLGSSLPATATWTASDSGGAGLKSYDLARSVDGGSFYVLLTGLASRSASVGLVPGHSYRFEVRAHDRAGNTGAWVAGPTLRPSLYQQSSTAIVYHGNWTTTISSVFSGGSARYATAYGASASLTTTARSLAFVSTVGPSRGAVRVYVDGVLRTTIDLYATTTSYRRVVFAQTWTSSGTHTIKVFVVGTAGRPRVDLDAFEIIR
jgi:N-acetylmuramoyl-L-alanine amidase/Bacterial Ig-like domain